jgi:hypothetical protein
LVVVTVGGGEERKRSARSVCIAHDPDDPERPCFDFNTCFEFKFEFDMVSGLEDA